MCILTYQDWFSDYFLSTISRIVTRFVWRNLPPILNEVVSVLVWEPKCGQVRKQEPMQYDKICKAVESKDNTKFTKFCRINWPNHAETSRDVLSYIYCANSLVSSNSDRFLRFTSKRMVILTETAPMPLIINTWYHKKGSNDAFIPWTRLNVMTSGGLMFKSDTVSESWLNRKRQYRMD